MKSATLCLVLLLSAAYHQGLCASIKENEIADSTAQLVNPEMAMSDIKIRDKRHIGLHICTYCCNCCGNKGCGYCCRT